MPELWLNPLVGQPPALWYSAKTQMTARISMNSVPTVALIQKCRLRSICLTAWSRASWSLAAGAFGSVSVPLSWEMS